MTVSKKHENFSTFAKRDYLPPLLSKLSDKGASSPSRTWVKDVYKSDKTNTFYLRRTAFNNAPWRGCFSSYNNGWLCFNMERAIKLGYVVDDITTNQQTTLF